MMRMPVAYGAALIVFCVLDFGWLSVMGPRLYKPALGELMGAEVRPLAAIAFYAIYLFGLVFFAVRPALAGQSWITAAQNGAVLGLVAYATYDLTNQATLRLWSVKVTVLDLAWGVLVSGLTATISYVVTARFVRSV